MRARPWSKPSSQAATICASCEVRSSRHVSVSGSLVSCSQLSCSSRMRTSDSFQSFPMGAASRDISYWPSSRVRMLSAHCSPARSPPVQRLIWLTSGRYWRKASSARAIHRPMQYSSPCAGLPDAWRDRTAGQSHSQRHCSGGSQGSPCESGTPSGSLGRRSAVPAAWDRSCGRSCWPLRRQSPCRRIQRFCICRSGRSGPCKLSPSTSS